MKISSQKIPGLEETHENKMSFSFVTVPNVIIISIVFLAVATLDQLAYLVYLCLFVLLFFSVKFALQTMSLVVLLNFLNPALVQLPDYSGIISRLLILIAVLRIILPNMVSQFRLVIPLLVYCLVVFALSIFVSRAAEISLMKLFFFGTTVSGVLVGFASIDKAETESLMQWFLSIAFVVVILSLPTYFSGAVGFKRNGFGFQGILNHPQAYGAFLAPYGAWILAGIVSATVKYRSLSVAVMFSFYLLLNILISKVRTSALALVLGIMTPIALSFGGLIKGQQFRSSRIFVIGSALGLAGLCAVVIQPGAWDFVTSFMTKGKGNEATIEEAFYSSRGKAAESHWYNFLARPFTGHGFGIYPSGEFPSGVKRFYGIPISASVEKGFLPSAILEETGLIGAIAFLWFLVSLIKRVLISSDIRWVCMFFACVFINVGEAVFFSVGGIGLYFWLLMGLCVASAKHSVR